MTDGVKKNFWIYQLQKRRVLTCGNSTERECESKPFRFTQFTPSTGQLSRQHYRLALAGTPTVSNVLSLYPFKTVVSCSSYKFV